MSEVQQNLQVSSIVVCGKVSLLSAQSLEQLAQNYHVIVAGRGDLQSRIKKIHIYDIQPGEEKFSQLFDAWQVNGIIYISGYADGGNGLDNEFVFLDKIMDCCKNNTISKLIVLSTINSLNFQEKYLIDSANIKHEYATGKDFAAAKFEETVQFYAKSIEQRTIILRIPYIISDMKNGNFISDIFSAMDSGTPVTFPYRRENRVDILSAEDLSDLLLHVLEEDTDQSASYNVSSGYHYTWGELEDTLKQIVPGTSVNYENGLNYIRILSFPIDLKRTYGFIPIDNVLERMPEYYAAYRDRENSKGSILKRFLKKAVQFLEERLIGYIELIVLFLLAQYLLKATGQSVSFQYVDVRLFFVILMGSVHGMQIGILAGVLECVSLFFDYLSIGINGTMVFYDIENWLPFTIYLMTGSVTGYMHTLHKRKAVFQEEENNLLRDRYLFLNDVYHGAIENKGEYRKQILGYKDSFGTIYDAVSKLDSDEPGNIFMNGITLAEKILKNRTIAVYTIDKGQHFGRLMACSCDMLQRLRKSIDLNDIPEVMSALRREEVFTNTGLNEEFPMYACGILEDGELSVIIAIYEAAPSQMSLYFTNLFSILCGLMRLSFLRAKQYQTAINQEKYYPGTQVLYTPWFMEIFNEQRMLTQNGMANCVILRFESRDVNDLDEKLRGTVRSRDVIGCDDDGNIILILLQMTDENAHIVTERLDKKGISYTIVQGGRL